jgi:8-oxo-dGTP pyrophosphatase MutT (NUDIX family)
VTSPEFVIPADRLPPGFAESLDRPPADVAEPKPAATVVMLRDSETGMEVLLLKRHRSSGFVPGAYVFPGGRTDDADGNPQLVGYVTRLPTINLPLHFWFAAVREVFEEAGVLLALDAKREWAQDTTASPELEAWRLKLMNEEATLFDVVQHNHFMIDFSGIVYFAHWITPLAEPRRYDTHFFAVVIPAGRTVRPDPREMTDALWLTPTEALRRFDAGKLPMVFPTVRTLKQLAPFQSTEAALDGLRARPVEPIMPRLVRTGTGVGIVIDPK